MTRRHRKAPFSRTPLFSGEQQIGSYERFWDGRDDARRLAPPGVYLYQLTTKTHERRFVETGEVRLVY